MTKAETRSLRETIREWPVKRPALRRQLVKQDICPQCGGELDTGWECNDCGFDAHPEVTKDYSHD